MKKTLCLILALLLLGLCPALSEGGTTTVFDPVEDPSPDFPEGITTQDAPEDIPLEVGDGDSTAGPTIFDNVPLVPQVSLDYVSLTNNTYKMVMERPASWVQIPGRYTICFAESVAAGQTPARIAVTRKTLSYTPDEDRVTKQLISYLKTLQGQYETFEVGDLDTVTPFLGQPGFSTVYTAQKGENTVRGYVIMTAIKRKIYVYHFSASESAYPSYATAMEHMRDSIVVNEE